MPIALTHSNFAHSTLYETLLIAGTILKTQISDSSEFPQTGSFKGVIWEAGYSVPSVSPTREIVNCTYSMSNEFIIVRSQEGTSAKEWPLGSNFAHVVTGGEMDSIVTTIDTHIGVVAGNPHGTSKSDIGLGNVDNTSDVNKPISSATQTALDGKVDENVAIMGATKTKITYDAKGLITSGADATTSDIADSTDKRYVTDAQLVIIGNTSGTNTGDQNLSGLTVKVSPSVIDNFVSFSDITGGQKDSGFSATETPTASKIPIADGTGKLDSGWLDPTLTSLSALGTAAGKYAYTTGIDTWAEGDISSDARTMLAAANNAAICSAIGMGTEDSPTFSGEILTNTISDSTLYQENSTLTSTFASATRIVRGASKIVKPIVPGGTTTSSSATGIYSETVRSAVGNTDDSGAMANIYGISFAGGHNYTSFYANPTTTSVTLINAIGYIRRGTITNLFSCYLGSHSSLSTPGIWSAGVGVTGGSSIVRPTVATGYYYCCSVSGTTGGSEPTWNTTPGGETIDNTATWKTIVIPSITNDWGLYQASTTAKNYFGSSLGIGVATFGANGTKVLQMGNGVSPTGSVADSFSMYSADIAAGNAAPHFRTEAGDVIKIYKATALTAQLTSITFTGPGTPDYALQDVTNTAPYGFADAEEARTFISVVSNLQVRVAQLEDRLKNSHGLIG